MEYYAYIENNKILITNSNITSFALANNPNIKYEYLDLKIKSNNE